MAERMQVPPPEAVSAVARRNRVNARRSTGPKTAAGKAAVAGNARRHGAQARPDRETLAAWTRVILGRADLSLDDLAGEWGLRVLALAEAEARLAACRAALRDCEADGAGEALEDLPPISDRDIMARFALLLDMAANGGRERGRLAARRRTLLRRYLGEARAGREKAFRAWIDCLESGRRDAAKTPKGSIPETKPDSI